MMRFIFIVVPVVIALVSEVSVRLGWRLVEGQKEENGIESNLKFIINHPLHKDRPASSLLDAPLSPKEITAMLSTVMKELNTKNLNQLIQLYQVTGGIKTSEATDIPLKDLWLIPGYYMLSLKDAITTLLILKESCDVWRPKWFPVMSSGSSDFIVFETKTGHMREIFLKESMGWDVAQDIQEFFSRSAHDLKSGKVFIDKSGLVHAGMSEDQGKIKNDIDNCPIPDTHVVGISLSPTIIFSCGNMPLVCQNIQNAVKNHGKPTNLVRITDKSSISANRRAACGHMVCTVPTKSCDEYPFASTSQGGTGATVLCVPLSENCSQGGQLNGFYRKNCIGNNDAFTVG